MPSSGSNSSNSLVFSDLVNLSSVFTLAIAALATTLLSEHLMAGIPASTTLTEHGPEGDHIIIETRGVSALPTLWIVYDGEAIYDVLESHKSSLIDYLYVVVFHAALHTPTIACFLLFLSIWVLKLRRSRPSNAALCVVAVLVGLAFLCDLAEDLGLVVIVVGFPSVRHPAVASTVAWCSMGKWWWWACVAVANAMAVLRFALHGKVKLAQE
jgi:hypothetical protein